MRRFLIILVIALSLSFVLFEEGDRTLLRPALRDFAVQALHNFSNAGQAPYNNKLYTGQADRTQRNVPSISAILELEDRQYKILVPQGSTVYDLMDKASSQYGFSFSGKSFPGMGFFVEEMKGVRQDSRKGLYWIYSINGKKAEVGVSNYILKPYDVITWSYEKGY